MPDYRRPLARAVGETEEGGTWFGRWQDYDGALVQAARWHAEQSAVERILLEYEDIGTAFVLSDGGEWMP